MSGIFVLAPVLAAAPVVLTAAGAMAAALGFTMLGRTADEMAALLEGVPEEQVVEFDIHDARGLVALVQEQGPLVLERGDARLCFRAAKGRCQLLVHGKGEASRKQLEELGRSALDRLNQQYAYHLVVSDLKERGFGKVEEAVDEDGTIRLRMRRWD